MAAGSRTSLRSNGGRRAPLTPGSLAARLLETLFARPTSAVTAALVGMVLIFSALEPTAFATGANLRNVATDASVLLIIAVGMTFVIITAGIDLSVGSVVVFGSVAAAKAMLALGGDGWATFAAGVAAALAGGLAWGALNGLLVARTKLNPLIVTLATLGMALGAAQVITDGTNISTVPLTVSEFGTGRLAAVPYLVLVALVVTVVGGVMLAFTRFGRYTYAIGSNAEAARRAGINVELHLLKVYALCGTLAGLGGFLSLARFSSTSISGHALTNLHTITGVVLGGTSLFGGIGNMFGSVVGIFIPAVLTNGFVIRGMQPFWQQITVGAVLLLAVYLDRVRRARIVSK